jgi:opacity protein-like surface antigen
MKSTHSLCRLGIPALAVAALLAGAGVHAQTSTPSTYPNSTYSNSWMPGQQGGYIGLNLGRSDYSLACGTLPLGCDNNGNFGRISLGAMVSPNFGYEIGYLNMGHADRAGGETKAQGLNFSLVGRVPVGSQFSLFGKLGTTYGRTRVSSAPGTGVAGGSESGFGLAYGLGASFDFNPKWSVVLEWERHDMKFISAGRDEVDATSLGLRYRF